jgi:hypothetical protein
VDNIQEEIREREREDDVVLTGSIWFRIRTSGDVL